MGKITLKKRAKQATAFLCAVGMCLTGGIGALAYDGTYEHLSLYVSAGKTDGDGSMKNPFGTVEEARDYIRELKKNGEYPKNGVTVNIREGVYEITKSIEFTSEDAGTADGDIVYRAYMDEEVDFVGGLEIPVSEFKKVTDEKVLDKVSGIAKSAVRQYNLYENGITREMIGEMELSGVAVTTREKQLYNNDYATEPSAKLFFNNSEMTIARWPNNGYANLGEVIDAGDITRNWADDRKGTADYVPPEDRPSYPRGFTVKIPSDKAKLWSTAPDGMIYGFFTYNWYDVSDNIKSIDVVNSTLTSQRDCSYGAVAGQEYYVFNMLEELDQPGEYYIDRESGVLYFYPPAASGECTISIIKGAVFSFGADANYIRIKNISMYCGRGRAVYARNVDSIGIEGCKIYNFASTGVEITEAHNSYVTDCHIHDVGMHAVLLNAPNKDYKTLTPCGNFMENNWCHDWGQKVATYSGAIRLSGVGGRISNNKFNSAPHLAVVLYGNDNLVEYNDISDVLKTSADSGAIYVGKSWIQRGLMIRNNYIHDIKSTQTGDLYGVYFDDFFCGGTVDKNIFENITGSGDIAAFDGGGRNTTVTNNICINTNAVYALLPQKPRYEKQGEESYKGFVKSRAQLWESTKGYGLYSDNFSEEVYSKYPNIMDFDENDLVDTINAKYSVFKNNVAWKTKNDNIYRAAAYGNVGLTKADLDEYYIKELGITMEHSLMIENDPGFVDYSSGNYELKSDSVIFEKLPDFEAPDAENMGLYTLRLKNRLKNSIAMKVNSPLSMVNFKSNLIDEDNDMVTPVLVNDTTMVPIRFIAELLGGEVNWHEAEKTADIIVGDKKLVIDANTGDMTVNGEKLESDAKPCIVNGRFVVPLRVISEKLNKTVEWHDGGLIIIGDSEQYFDEENYADTLLIGEMCRRLSY